MNRTYKLSCLIVSLFILGVSQSVFSQTVKDVFNNSETSIFYLGIDFTEARLIDDTDANEMDIRDRLYASINDVVVNEPKKYDLKGAFHKSYIDHDLGEVTKRNRKINAQDIKSTNTGDFHRLKEENISKLVKGFDFGDKKGVGLLFIMEAMNKSQKAAAIWTTLVDMKSKKVLMTERVESKASMAFGFRNYWASTIANLIEAIEKRKYNEWKSRYGG